jgi:hypothetical protein
LWILDLLATAGFESASLNNPDGELISLFANAYLTQRGRSIIHPLLEHEADHLAEGDKHHRSAGGCFSAVRADKVIDPASLADDDKAQFSNQLYQLHSRIFDGVTRERFVSCVICRLMQWTRTRGRPALVPPARTARRSITKLYRTLAADNFRPVVAAL